MVLDRLCGPGIIVDNGLLRGAYPTAEAKWRARIRVLVPNLSGETKYVVQVVQVERCYSSYSGCCCLL